MEYYHNSSWLEYGGSPDKAIRSAFLSVIDNYLRENSLYKKDEKNYISGYRRQFDFNFKFFLNLNKL